MNVADNEYEKLRRKLELMADDGTLLEGIMQLLTRKVDAVQFPNGQRIRLDEKQ